MKKGRPATRPQAGWKPPERLTNDGEVVFFEPEKGEQSAQFRFDDLPLSKELRQAFAEAFAIVTGPTGPQRAWATARSTHSTLRHFARVLAEAEFPPLNPAGLKPAHLTAARLSSAYLYRRLKPVLREVRGTSPAFAAALLEANPPRRTAPVTSLTRTEYLKVMSVGRRDLRLATERIRRNREHHERWKAGDFSASSRDGLRGQILDCLSTTGDLPREETTSIPNCRPSVQPWVQEIGSSRELSSSLFLTWREAMSAAVLLVGLTGQNFSGIGALMENHVRADGLDGLQSTRTALVDIDKPRRGPRDRYMTMPLSDTPDRIIVTEEESPRQSLNTPFGVFATLVELGLDARRLSGSSRLILYLASTGGASSGRHWANLTDDGNSIRDWARAHELENDLTPGGGLRLTWPRLRLTFLRFHQRGVAHNDRTLADQYLLRDRQNYQEYQELVAEVLSREESKARDFQGIQTLSVATVEEARTRPATVAKSLDIEVPTLNDLVEGRLDTVLAGCVDELHSPYSPVGSPCVASFLMCLKCPNARSTPAHLPVQALTLHRMLELRDALPPHRWAHMFAESAARLSDLLNKHPEERVTTALASTTPEQLRLVDRFLEGRLDHR